MEEPTSQTVWLVPTLAIAVVFLLVGLAFYELGSNAAFPESSNASASTVTSSHSLPAGPVFPNINGSTCDQQSMLDEEAAASIPMSEQKAVSIAESSSKYEAETAGAATVNFTGIAQGWSNGGGNCTPFLQFLAVNFAMQTANMSCYDVVIQVNPYSGNVVGADRFEFLGSAPLGGC